jgi:flagellum-specific peptidoglycan hydrolase FlgJ
VFKKLFETQNALYLPTQNKLLAMGSVYTTTNTRSYGSSKKAGNPSWLGRNWFNLVLLYVSGHFVFQKEVSLDVSLPGRQTTFQAAGVSVLPTATAKEPGPETWYVPASNVSQFKKIREQTEKVDRAKTKPTTAVPGFSIRNLTPLLSPDYARRKGIPKEVVAARVQVCKDYVARYTSIAQEEMRTYGIPASITLAQGLLESDAGESVLARESLNHFGIKCRTKCIGCTCRNYADDVAHDMFRVFEEVGESFREHSLLLNSPRYKALKKLDASDYKGWARGLKKAGYATDPHYAEKLIRIIEALDLNQYDVKA